MAAFWSSAAISPTRSSPIWDSGGALIASPFLTAIIGLAVEKTLISRVYGRDPHYSLLLTFGLAFILEDGTRVIWGANGKPFTIPAVLAQPLSNQFFFITGYRLF